MRMRHKLEVLSVFGVGLMYVVIFPWKQAVALDSKPDLSVLTHLQMQHHRNQHIPLHYPKYPCGSHRRDVVLSGCPPLGVSFPPALIHSIQTDILPWTGASSSKLA